MDEMFNISFLCVNVCISIHSFLCLLSVCVRFRTVLLKKYPSRFVFSDEKFKI